ncbi:MAG TPA: transposase [Azoarcus taiwanensis]|nr:transposase [Azoarcus taiwanensis]
MNAQSHLLRKGRFSETGRIYLVTTVIRERAPVFSDLQIARTAIAQLRHVTNAFACETLAFVLMPDHLHWLVQLNRAELSRAVGAFKANSARQVNLRLRMNGQALWQKGFHDHALRREESLLDLGRYVVMNPVRAGLVRRPGEYPHWDAFWV